MTALLAVVVVVGLAVVVLLVAVDRERLTKVMPVGQISAVVEQ